MDKIRGSLCLGWKRVYRSVCTRKSNSYAVAASWWMNKATKGKKTILPFFNLVSFHLLVFNKRHGYRNIALYSEKTTDQSGLKFRKCAPEVSTVLAFGIWRLLSAH